MEKKKFDIYEMVTDRIIHLLEQNIVPWKKPWHDGGVPTNVISGYPYRGINLLLLGLAGYKQNLFLSFKQVKDVGGSVKKDEKANLVVFWKALKQKDEDSNVKVDTQESKPKPVKRILRYYYVFNVEQCTGIPSDLIPDIRKDNDRIASCEAIVEHMPERPEIRYDENSAFYVPKEDYVNVPDIEYFSESNAFYATLFHELIHSTGHPKRLNRKEIAEPIRYGTDPYSTEELVAELGSCFLQSYTGTVFAHMGNSASYISGWLEKLHGDKRCLIHAAGAAQRACDYILGVHLEEPSEETLSAHAETSAI